MIAKLEFTLPEESQEHLMAVHAVDLVCALHDVSDMLRKLDKYGDTTLVEIATIRQKFHEILQEHNVESLI